MYWSEIGGEPQIDKLEWMGAAEKYSSVKVLAGQLA